MDSINTIGLTQVLPYLNKQQESNITLFINNKGDLETFLNYKGHIIDIYKLKIKIDLGKNSVEEIGEEIRSQIIIGLHKG